MLHLETCWNEFKVGFDGGNLVWVECRIPISSVICKLLIVIIININEVVMIFRSLSRRSLVSNRYVEQASVINTASVVGIKNFNVKSIKFVIEYLSAPI